MKPAAPVTSTFCPEIEVSVAAPLSVTPASYHDGSSRGCGDVGGCQPERRAAKTRLLGCRFPFSQRRAQKSADDEIAGKLALIRVVSHGMGRKY